MDTYKPLGNKALRQWSLTRLNIPETAAVDTHREMLWHSARDSEWTPDAKDNVAIRYLASVVADQSLPDQDIRPFLREEASSLSEEIDIFAKSFFDYRQPDRQRLWGILCRKCRRHPELTARLEWLDKGLTFHPVDAPSYPRELRQLQQDLIKVFPQLPAERALAWNRCKEDFRRYLNANSGKPQLRKFTMLQVKHLASLAPWIIEILDELAPIPDVRTASSTSSDAMISQKPPSSQPAEDAIITAMPVLGENDDIITATPVSNPIRATAISETQARRKRSQANRQATMVMAMFIFAFFVVVGFFILANLAHRKSSHPERPATSDVPDFESRIPEEWGESVPQEFPSDNNPNSRPAIPSPERFGR